MRGQVVVAGDAAGELLVSIGAAQFLGRLRFPDRRDYRPAASALGSDRDRSCVGAAEHDRIQHNHCGVARSNSGRNRTRRPF